MLGVEAAVLPAVELEAPQPAMVIPSAKSTVNVPILWFHLIRKPSFSCLTERFRSATIKTIQRHILFQDREENFRENLKSKMSGPHPARQLSDAAVPGAEPGPPEQGPAGEQDQAERQKAAAFRPRDGR